MGKKKNKKGKSQKKPQDRKPQDDEVEEATKEEGEEEDTNESSKDQDDEGPEETPGEATKDKESNEQPDKSSSDQSSEQENSSDSDKVTSDDGDKSDKESSEESGKEDTPVSEPDKDSKSDADSISAEEIDKASVDQENGSGEDPVESKGGESSDPGSEKGEKEEGADTLSGDSKPDKDSAEVGNKEEKSDTESDKGDKIQAEATGEKDEDKENTETVEGADKEAAEDKTTQSSLPSTNDETGTEDHKPEEDKAEADRNENSQATSSDKEEDKDSLDVFLAGDIDKENTKEGNRSTETPIAGRKEGASSVRQADQPSKDYETETKADIQGRDSTPKVLNPEATKSEKGGKNKEKDLPVDSTPKESTTVENSLTNTQVERRAEEESAATQSNQGRKADVPSRDSKQDKNDAVTKLTDYKAASVLSNPDNTMSFNGDTDDEDIASFAEASVDIREEDTRSKKKETSEVNGQAEDEGKDAEDEGERRRSRRSRRSPPEGEMECRSEAKWFFSNLSKPDVVMSALSDDVQRITPSGQVVCGPEDVVRSLETLSKISHCRLAMKTGPLHLISYEAIIEERITRSTALLRMDESNKTFQWLHIQDTYLSDSGDMGSGHPEGSQTQRSAPSPHGIKIPPNATSSKRRFFNEEASVDFKDCSPFKFGDQVVGINIAGWTVETAQGPIGGEEWFLRATDLLEDQAQPGADPGSRRLNLPEMVFPWAGVTIKMKDIKTKICWTAVEALEEWAKAHKRIEIDGTNEIRGVSVLKSLDAKLWKIKNREIARGSTSFHYDWTYSTPFCGSIDSGSSSWSKHDTSQLPMEMLKDRSMPILLFDDVILYEDDMHDNGLVQLSVKVRVMPKCAYVLARLWLRVDNVVLRLRETRLLVEFEKKKIYRDVTWRECKWEDLGANSLPTELRDWCQDETPEFVALTRKLPVVKELPDDIYAYASMDL